MNTIWTRFQAANTCISRMQFKVHQALRAHNLRTFTVQRLLLVNPAPLLLWLSGFNMLQWYKFTEVQHKISAQDSTGAATPVIQGSVLQKLSHFLTLRDCGLDCLPGFFHLPQCLNQLFPTFLWTTSIVHAECLGFSNPSKTEVFLFQEFFWPSRDVGDNTRGESTMSKKVLGNIFDTACSRDLHNKPRKLQMSSINLYNTLLCTCEMELK